MRYLKPIALSVLGGLSLWPSGCGEKTAAAPPPAPPTVEVAHPLEREVTDYADYVGRTAAIDSVEVRARVTGYLQAVKFKEGELVKKGQVLFEIDPRLFEAQVASSRAQVASAAATLKRAESDNTRYEWISEKTPGAVSKQDVDKYQATAKARPRGPQPRCARSCRSRAGSEPAQPRLDQGHRASRWADQPILRDRRQPDHAGPDRPDDDRLHRPDLRLLRHGRHNRAARASVDARRQGQIRPGRRGAGVPPAGKRDRFPTRGTNQF